MQLEHIIASESETNIIIKITCSLQKEKDKKLLVQLFNMAFFECCVGGVVPQEQFDNSPLNVLTNFQMVYER